ncbi:hypothetical protein KQX54_011895 [Cotesia glomerata]|uniref:Uncharacterized protein n=1 Tax=Cotesia glomerata TaxID=32391 RepID=A0AAV7ICU1_COTGL|nr:hypothetical protein KQX54_011895 [Cotesia glomerata]
MNSKGYTRAHQTGTWSRSLASCRGRPRTRPNTDGPHLLSSPRMKDFRPFFVCVLHSVPLPSTFISLSSPPSQTDLFKSTRPESE